MSNRDCYQIMQPNTHTQPIYPDPLDGSFNLSNTFNTLMPNRNALHKSMLKPALLTNLIPSP